MQVSVESPSKLERRLKVIVPVDRMNEAYGNRIALLAKDAKIAGFRPGKAPLKVVEQRYGSSARNEAISEVIKVSLYDAMDQEKLVPVEAPTVEPIQISPGQPIEYIATFEVMPEVGKIEFNVSSLEKETAKVEQEDIQRVLDHLISQHTEWKKVEREAREKDRVIIDFKGSIDGVFFAGGEAHDYPIVLGSKTMIPGFEEGILGMKAGDEKIIPITFPEDYFSAETAGKKAEFTIKAISVSEPVLPELNENFVKKLGIKSGQIEDLHAEIQKNLERELERIINLKLKNQVFGKLLEQNEIEIPKALIEREASRIHDEVHPQHDHHHNHTDAEMENFRKAAKKNVTLGLIMSEVIRTNQLKTDKQRVNNHIDKLASAYENPAELKAWFNSDKRAYAEIEMQVLEEQVLEVLLKEVQVIDKMMSYSEITSNN